MNNKKPIAIFDIDGTIFRSSLLIELNAKLVLEGIFPARATNEVARVREAWLNRHGSYTDYINTIVELYLRDIKGAKATDIRRISREVIAEQKHRVYVYTRELIQRLRRTHTLIVISLSPIEIVRAFNSYYRFDVISGTVYLQKKGRYIGEIAQETVMDKRSILERIVRERGFSLRGSIGVGDTESDISFLKLVDRPIAFNPNKTLYSYAKKHRWKIVVERKDVVYFL